MSKYTLQIQSVLYCNEKNSILTALRSIEKAVQINRESTKELEEVCVYYGDASPAPLYTEEEIKEIKAEFSATFDFEYFYFNENTGSAKGQTLLSHKSDSDYLLVMNPDVIVSPRIFTKLIAPFKNPELNAGVVEGRQTPIEHAKEYDRKTLETDWVTGAFFLCPTVIFKEVNGFDYESFFMYCDDVDFSWRVRLLGKKLYFCPDAVVFHAKTLGNHGEWQPTGAEVFYSAQAAILMAYKWSNPARVKKLCRAFRKSNDKILNDAVDHFEKLKAEGKLPQQLDPHHKVAKFVGDYYTKHRFVI